MHMHLLISLLHYDFSLNFEQVLHFIACWFNYRKKFKETFTSTFYCSAIVTPLMVIHHTRCAGFVFCYNYLCFC